MAPMLYTGPGKAEAEDPFRSRNPKQKAKFYMILNLLRWKFHYISSACSGCGSRAKPFQVNSGFL
jgi:hypothetical protein